MTHSDYYKEFYSEYGRFIVSFENVCFAIRRNLVYLLNVGYDEFESKVLFILLEGLTAKPLMEKWYAIHLLKYNEVEIKILKTFKKKFENLQSIRNSMSHGTADLGHYIQEGEIDLTIFTLFHPKIKSKGYDDEVKLIKIEDLKKLSNEVADFADCISRFGIVYVRNNERMYKSAIEFIELKLSQIIFQFDSIIEEVS